MGFTKSFNSNVFCRFCITQKKNTQNDTFIRQENLRNVENYNDHLKLNDIKQTGIAKETVFHKLKNFHVTKNYYSDIFHDLYEGIVKYEISKVLEYYIYNKKICSLHTFNQLLTQFNYGEIEMGNIPKEVTDQQIKSGKIRWTGGQTKIFLHFVSLILGHLVSIDDEDYVYWQFLTELIVLTDMLLVSNITQTYLQNLKSIIEHHLQMYIELFGPLKPKHHFVLHYPELMIQVGPLRNLMCFVYEQKNRQLKVYAHVMNQRVNLSFSLASKAAFKFDQLMKSLAKQGLPPKITDDKSFAIKYEDLVTMGLDTLFQVNADTCNDIRKVKMVKLKNKVFKPSYYIFEKGTNEEEKLFEIKEIIFICNKYFLIGQQYEFEYSSHYKSFSVGNQLPFIKLIDLIKVQYLPFNLHKTFNGQKFFRIKNV